MTGLFITLEGGEGAGKSLQAKALAHRLETAGRTVVCTREPGGTPLGERLREIVLEFSGDDVPLDPVTETLIFLTARAVLVTNVIAPALKRGDVVVCDRFADSTRAYQGIGRGLDLAVIEPMNRFATQGICPALTVLLDLPVEEGLARTRAAGSDDRFGREDVAFHERVRRGYLTLANDEPARWLVVDATQPPDAVTDAIWQRLKPLL
ncbi:MAG: dTMP kinase [Dehalococcoidia bacterium]